MTRTLTLLVLLIGFVFLAAFTNNPGVKSKNIKIKTVSQLGEKLFFDTILSKNYSISCSSCHKPNFAFSDNVALSFGVDSIKTKRNTPTVMNVEEMSSFFWDGRASSLEQQALMPIEHPDEMGLPITEAIKRLNDNPEYSRLFKKIFKSKASKENIGISLAEFQKSLGTANSPFDRWMNGNEGAMNESAIRGREIFNTKGKCFDCHFGPDFTGNEFKNIGLFNGLEFNDVGRFEISKDSSDLGKFKVPGLRNIAVTAPYMHNGMFTTLRESIEFYNQPDKFVKNRINEDSLMLSPLNLSEQEITDIEEFLKALTDSRFSYN
ncbi:MAG: c-type cytochrome [Bacteroidetes bacterium]|nr:c-type cytochrome [Bacteroidota bacterium]HET6243342.1 cytochrome c peroxidase [Bacteroidia bacterium]